MAMPVRKDDPFPHDPLVIQYPCAAGIDIGASFHMVAVAQHLSDMPVRKFGPMTDDINKMADWLIECGVDKVALESTGVYWIPVHEILEQRGLEVLLVDARQMKYTPGRKSDVQDCQWLQSLMSYGLLRGAFRPVEDICVIRAIARQRSMLVAEQATWVQRMQKALVQMNIQLREVLSDVMGQTGQAIIRAIVAGERNPAVLAKHRNKRIKAKIEDVERALTGNWREEHLFALGQALEMFDNFTVQINKCNERLEQLLGKGEKCNVDIGKPPKEGTKARAQFDLRQQLANFAGVDLTRINGLGVGTIMTIISEIGTDLSRFATVKHFCSWLGLTPGTKISGGKVLSAKTKKSANRARQAFKIAAMALAHSDCSLGSFYRRMCAKKDKPTANTAVAHKLARLFYYMLTRGESFVADYQKINEERFIVRKKMAVIRNAQELGLKLIDPLTGEIDARF